MKKLTLFVWNFSLFFGLVWVMAMGAVSAIYLAFCFVSWSMLGMDHIAENALLAARIAVVLSFAITTSWIFTDGRREWDW